MVLETKDGGMYFTVDADTQQGSAFYFDKSYMALNMDLLTANSAEMYFMINNGGSSYARFVIGQASNGWFFQNNGYDEDLKIGETTGDQGSGTYTNRILISSSRMQIGDSSNDLKLSVSGSITSNNTASAAYFVGDGSQLTNLPASSTFPFTGDAVITGSLLVSGSSEVTGSFSVTSDAGHMFQINNDGTFTLGDGAAVASSNATAVGNGANAGPNSTVFGNAANASGGGGISFGSFSSANGTYGVALGYDADSSTSHAISIGPGITNSGANSIILHSRAYNQKVLNSDAKAFKIFMGSQTVPDFVISSSNESKLSGSSFTIENSGSTVFDVIGSQGTLFSVDDDLSGTIFTANDISGLPILEASASGDVYIGKSPQSLYTTAVISSTTAATTQSIFGLSTSSYDGAFFDYTVQSGSDARAGSIMAVWNGGNISFTETTTTDIGNTTDFNLIVHISQSQAQIASHATNAGYKIKTIIRSI